MFLYADICTVECFGLVKNNVGFTMGGVIIAATNEFCWGADCNMFCGVVYCCFDNTQIVLNIALIECWSINIYLICLKT